MDPVFEKILKHLGHKVEAIAYGDHGDPRHAAIECTECHEVIVSQSKDDHGEHATLEGL